MALQDQQSNGGKAMKVFNEHSVSETPHFSLYAIFRVRGSHRVAMENMLSRCFRNGNGMNANKRVILFLL
jgi:hypothetical protein